MRGFFIGLAVVVAAVLFSLALGAATEQLNTQGAANFNRACRFTSANIQIITATGSATGSTQTLTPGSAYKMLCTADTNFRESATVGSTGALLKANTFIDVWAKSGDYVSVQAVAATGTCNLTECL